MALVLSLSPEMHDPITLFDTTEWVAYTRAHGEREAQLDSLQVSLQLVRPKPLDEIKQVPCVWDVWVLRAWWCCCDDALANLACICASGKPGHGRLIVLARGDREKEHRALEPLKRGTIPGRGGQGAPRS